MHTMDTGQIVLIYSRLIAGALTAFFAITLWSKTRDIAWMFMVMGAIVMYGEVVWSIPELLGIGHAPLPAILPPLRMAFFMAACMVMAARRRKT